MAGEPHPDLRAAFSAGMEAAGPWEPAPHLAAAVSGGADSSALALLADDWARRRGGSLLALIVDHGLRADSADEAVLTHDRLRARGIAARVLPLQDLRPGPALAERARRARYAALAAACAEAGIVHLLIGHHAADQAETVMIRTLGGSASRGLAAMAALAETCGPRLLRPLLAVPPAALRAFLTGAGMAWVEDPSNANRAALRGRLRLLRGDAGAGTRPLVFASAIAGQARSSADQRAAAILARRATLRPEGFAVLSPGAIDPEAMAALLRVIGAAAYAPPPALVAGLARDPRPMTLAGVRVLPAGRMGPGWLVVREEAAIAPAGPVRPGMIWDGRFRLVVSHGSIPDGLSPDGLSIGALGALASRVRRGSDLPAVVLRTLPALFRGNLLAAVPHLSYRLPALCPDLWPIFQPPRPMAGAPFLPVVVCSKGSCGRWGCDHGEATLC